MTVIVISSMFGLTGTPPRQQRRRMSQTTGAVEDKLKILALLILKLLFK